MMTKPSCLSLSINRQTGCVNAWTCLRYRPLDAYTASTYNNFGAGVAELADAADLKSAGVTLVGSSPTPGTNRNRLLSNYRTFKHNYLVMLWTYPGCKPCRDISP